MCKNGGKFKSCVIINFGHLYNRVSGVGSKIWPEI